MKLWDPHFHLWDISARTQSGHDPKNLFKPNENPVYSLDQFEKDLAISDLELVGGACVEAMSVCHVEYDSTAFSSACISEAHWLSNQLSRSHRNYVIVASAALESSDLSRILGTLARIPFVHGVRQILNHEPSWPRNKRLGNLLENPKWIEGYASLADFGLSFDLQLNPSQFKQALKIVSKHPNIPVVINHLGCPTLVDLRNEYTYWEGFRAFADLEHVKIKLSMLSYLDPDWHLNALVKEMVLRVVELFGVNRCCLASNLPVESNLGWNPCKLIREFRKLFSHFTQGDQQKLFVENARRFYSA